MLPRREETVDQINGWQSAIRLLLALVLGGSIGFDRGLRGNLGAGSILHARGKVRGLTTASSIWLAAAIGMAAGGGFHSGAPSGRAGGSD